jgi:hypothetical protein
MRKGQNRTTKTTLRSERSSVLKNDLTGPTLLEMSGYATNQELKIAEQIRLKQFGWLRASAPILSFQEACEPPTIRFSQFLCLEAQTH